MKNMELKNKFKNKYMIRVAAGAVAIAVLGTSAGTGGSIVRAQKDKKDAQESHKDSKTDKKEVEKTLKKVLSASEETEEASKEETVYVVANADGSAKNVIVSEWLKNKDGEATLKDASDLKDIENVKGEETFTQNGDQITWEAGGNDIYYQGTTDKKLPITEKVTYFLDGKEMEPQEIAGKSGKIKIRFDYTNNEKTTQIVEGEEHEVYVPFTVLTGMILPEDYNNVEITNGKVISDGNRKVAVGMAMPGLKESLDIQEEELDGEVKIPDYVEITADVEKFSLEMTMTIAINDLLEGRDLGEAFDVSELEDDMDTLTDASKKLVSGSKELTKGLSTLKNSMKEFTTGADTLKDGISSYTSGASQLNDGIQTLSGSSGALISGVSILNGSAADLNSGVAQLDQTLKSEMTAEEKASLIQQADEAIESTFQDQNSGTEAIKNQAAATFYESLANNQTAKEQVSAGLGTYTETILDSVLETAYTQVAGDSAKKDQMAQYKPQVVQAVTQAVVQQVTQSVTSGVMSTVIQQQAAAMAEQAGGALNAEAVAAICNAVNEAVNTEGSEAQSQINALVAQQDINGLVASNVEAQIDAALNSEEGKAQIKATVDDLVNQTVATAMASDTLLAGMDSTAAQIVAGIADGAKDTVGAAVADTAKTAAKTAAEAATLTAVDGTKAQISEAINATDSASGYSLVTGMQALSQGTQTMSDNMPALTDGIHQLTNGAALLVSNNGALTDGASKLSGAATQIGEGVQKLAKGSNQLMDGMIEFDKEGIQKLMDAYDGDVKTLLNKLEAVVNAGKEYQSFTRVAKGTKGSVKFIFRTEAIKTEEE